MADAIHPAASHHLPGFITAPGETDVLMAVSLVLLLAMILGIGVFYFRLHALPEQIAHKGEKVQLQIVAILALIALFTHNHAYWIAALILAFVKLPDFSTPLSAMANSLARIAGAKSFRPRAEAAPPAGRVAGPSGASKIAVNARPAGDA